MIILINAIFFGLVSRILGGLLTKTNDLTGELENAVPRFVSISAVIIVLGFNYMMQPLMIIPMFLAFWAIRMLPTQALFSAIHGQAPARTDGAWQFLQDWTFKLWRKLPENYQNWYLWAIIYGAVRCSLLLPLAVVNPWLLVFLGLGLLYYFAGRVSDMLKLDDKGAAIAEVTIGAIFGAIL
jgi:hypothetical protein